MAAADLHAAQASERLAEEGLGLIDGWRLSVLRRRTARLPPCLCGVSRTTAATGPAAGVKFIFWAIDLPSDRPGADAWPPAPPRQSP